MQLVRFPLGQMQANCYFLIEGNEWVIIDPGDSADFILEELLRRNLALKAIFATHGHVDHILAVGEIQSNFPVPFHIHKDDMFLVQRTAETAEYFLGYKPAFIPPQNFNFLEEQPLRVLGTEIIPILTPGHTPGSVCLYIKNESVLFSGDTLFKEGIGRYDFKYSDKHELKKSLEKLFALEEIIQVYPGHGEDTLLHIEKDTALSFF